MTFNDIWMALCEYPQKLCLISEGICYDDKTAMDVFADRNAHKVVKKWKIKEASGFGYDLCVDLEE